MPLIVAGVGGVAQDSISRAMLALMSPEDYLALVEARLRADGVNVTTEQLRELRP
jgi:hypothetical protein